MNELSEKEKEKLRAEVSLSEKNIQLGKRIAELEALIAKYEERRCNKGHENTLPLRLWDCPACTEELRALCGELVRVLITYKSVVTLWETGALGLREHFATAQIMGSVTLRKAREAGIK